MSEPAPLSFSDFTWPLSDEELQRFVDSLPDVELPSKPTRVVRLRVPPRPRYCAVCGGEITAKRVHAVTCSDRCRQRLCRARRS